MSEWEDLNDYQRVPGKRVGEFKGTFMSEELKPCPFHNFPCANCLAAARKRIEELENKLVIVNKVFGDGDREAFMARYQALETRVVALGDELRKVIMKGTAIRKYHAFCPNALEFIEFEEAVESATKLLESMK